MKNGSNKLHVPALMSDKTLGQRFLRELVWRMSQQWGKPAGFALIRSADSPAPTRRGARCGNCWITNELAARLAVEAKFQNQILSAFFYEYISIPIRWRKKLQPTLKKSTFWKVKFRAGSTKHLFKLIRPSLGDTLKLFSIVFFLRLKTWRKKMYMQFGTCKLWKRYSKVFMPWWPWMHLHPTFFFSF